MKTKLTTCEKRAESFCRSLIQNAGGTVQIEWKRSQMWGHNPVILHRGEKCCNVGGCGYDKQSTALADVLRFLFPIGSAPYNEVWATGGCGESATMRTLAKHGWTMRKVANSSTFDGYELTLDVMKPEARELAVA